MREMEWQALPAIRDALQLLGDQLLGNTGQQQVQYPLLELGN
jgi:hypothetical protein